MNVLDLCREIKIPSQVYIRLIEIDQMKDLFLSCKEIDSCIQGLGEPDTAKEAYEKLNELLDDDEDKVKLLYCYLLCATKQITTYENLGISYDIYIATMKCFSRFLVETYNRLGKWFFDRGWWTYRQVSLTLFRIGELEFERRYYNDEKVVSIHIPSDANFSSDRVEQSILLAKKFLSQHYPEYKNSKFICNSWLLSPQLIPLLDSESNIAKFYSRFSIVENKTDLKDYIEWLFQSQEDTPLDKLPEKTSLQRKVKEYMRSGKFIGAGFGILK